MHGEEFIAYNMIKVGYAVISVDWRSADRIDKRRNQVVFFVCFFFFFCCCFVVVVFFVVFFFCFFFCCVFDEIRL